MKDLGEIAKKAVLNPASTTHVPETQINDSGEVLTDDSPNDFPGLREIESEEFDSIIRQLNDELANLSPATQPFTNSKQRPILITPVHPHPTSHRHTAENVITLSVDTRG